ncbi:MAG: TonB-dependent receptor [Gemmatimonadota bacterium]
MRIGWLPPALLLSLLVVTPALAQNPPAAAPGRISGSVLTADSAKPLPAAAITVRNATDSVIITGALTEKNGGFRVDGLPYGRYLLRISLLGYKSRNSEVITINAERSAFDLGPIKLEISAIQLPGVEATVEKAPVVQEADRTVYNTKTMPQSAGSTIDVLKAIPDLEVDINNNVKMKGNQTIAVQINGRSFPLRGEQLANFLQQMPGNRIKSIEVIQNPSAKNNPEEMGGILNIVLDDKIELGISGSVNASTSTRNQQSFGGRLNFQRGRLTLFTGMSGNYYAARSTSYDLRTNLLAKPLTNIETNSANDNSSWGGYGDVTAEFKVGKQAAFSTTSYWHYSAMGNDGLLKYGILDEAMANIDRYDRDSRNDGSFGNYDVGLSFRQIFVPQRHELSISGRISDGGNDSENVLTKEYLLAGGQPADLPIELTRNEFDSGNGNLSIQADYFRPLGKGRIDVGYRSWLREQDNDNVMRIFPNQDPNTTPSLEARSGYLYDEVFHSFYTTVSRPFGKFSAQAGLRAELTTTHFESRTVDDLQFDRDYNTLYPSFNFSYAPRPGRTARLSFTRSIQRPSPSYLNPVVPSVDNLNRSIGNPDLKPSYMYNYRFNLTYSGKKGSFNAGPYYTHRVQMWERIRTVDSLGVATNRWENGNYADQYGTSIGVSLPSTGNLNGNLSMSVYREIRDGSNISAAYRREAWMTSYYGYFGYKLRTNTTATVNANYMPSQNILQGRASGYMWMDVGIRQQLWGTKGSLSVSISDPLALQKYNSNTRDASYVQSSRSSYSSRMARIGFNWNFGKPPQRLTRGMEGGGETGEVIRVR